MTRFASSLAAGAFVATMLAGTAFAQETPQVSVLQPPSVETGQSAPRLLTQNFSPRSVDSGTLDSGRRVSKFIGTEVVNESNESIGKIDDVIVMTNARRSSYAVISVGDFLGIEARNVAIPCDTLEVRDKQVVLRGASRERLKALPAYKYPN